MTLLFAHLQKYNLESAFVTFNRSAEREACIDACPQGWARSWIQKKDERFRGTHRFYCRRASAPEDYLYENMACSRFSRASRMVRASDD